MHIEKIKKYNYSEIWKIALPIMIGGVAQNVVTVTDTMFLSKVGKVELGAAGNSGIFYFIFIVLGLGFATGAQIIIGRRNGEKKLKEIGSIFDQTLLFLIPFGILLTIALKFLAPAIMDVMIKSEGIYDASVKFINYRIIGITFAFVSFAMNALYVGITKTKVITYATVLMSSVNILLDYGLIFGNFGLPKLGIEGAAIASVIAEIVSFAFLVLYTYFSTHKDDYSLFRTYKTNFKTLLQILKIAVPTMVQLVATLGSWFMFFTLIEGIGESELAISHIIRSIYMVMMIPMFGLSAAANTIVSNLIGENRSEIIMSTTWKIIALSIICSLPIAILNWTVPYHIISLFTDDSELISGCYNTLQVVTVTMFLFSVAFIFFNSVTGTGNTLMALLIEVINIVIYLTATVLLITYYNPPIEIVWCAEFIYFFFLGLMSWWYLKSGKWKNKSI